MTMPWYEQAFMHCFAGFVASGADRIFSKNSGRFTQQRIKDKVGKAESLQYLVEHLRPSEDSTEFHNHVMNAREYFEDRGISTERETSYPENLGLWDRAKQAFGNIGYYKNHERFNNRSLGGKLAAATGFELIGDCLALLGQITIGKGDVAVALGEDIYQIPSFYLGLLTGRGALHVKDYFTVSKEEKELDRMASELTSDGKILEIVRNYSPTAHIVIPEKHNVIDVIAEPVEKPAIGSEETKTPRIGYESVGEKIGGGIADTVIGTGRAISSGIGAITRRFQKRKDIANAEEKAEEEARRKKLRDLYED